MKVAKYGTIISGLITIILATYDLFIKYILQAIIEVETNVNSAYSIGIIGGADGPTAIYLTSKNPAKFKYILMIIFFAITIFFAMKWKNTLNKQ